MEISIHTGIVILWGEVLEMERKLKPWETPLGIILTKYYKEQARLERLRKLEITIREDIQEIKDTIQLMTSTPQMTAKYGYHAGGGGAGDSIASMVIKLEKETERAHMLLPDKFRRLISIRHRIHGIREWISNFDLILGRLTDEERRILEMKYHYRRSNRTISDLLHCDEGKIRYMHRKMIFYIMDSLESKRVRGFSARGGGYREKLVI